MLLLEINEFNPDLMQQAADELDAPNLKRLLSLKKSCTITKDKGERFGLDPWVQWVSIHTGQPSSIHGVRHLADLSSLKYAQIWETLGKAGLRCGVWGAMNARKGNGENINFFMTDPWTFDQPAYPAHLNAFLALPVYYAKHYGHTHWVELLKATAKTSCFLLRPSVLKALLPIMPEMFGVLVKEGFKSHVLFALFDLVNAVLFLEYYRKYKPDFSILFLNSLAHVQHHKWSSKTELGREMLVSFRVFDRILEKIFTGMKPGEPLVVVNSFTQVCTIDDKEFLYRQKNPERFLQQAGIPFEHIEQLMTNDAHVFFASPDDAVAAMSIISEARLEGAPIFDVGYDPHHPTRLFYQLSFWKKVDDNARLTINGKQFRFLDVFYCVTQRGGSHSAEGHVFTSGLTLPDHLFNHELHDHLLTACRKS